MFFNHVILYSFIIDNDEGCGWVIKAPFTTNSAVIRFPKTPDDIFEQLNALYNTFHGSLPYLMLQACMYNRKEYKIVMFDGEPLFRGGDKGSGNKRSTDGVNQSFSTNENLLQFSLEAIIAAKLSCSSLLCDGLFRVDIFINAQNNLVVNEFESLEAYYHCANHNEEMAFFELLNKFWCDKVVFCVNSYLSR